MNELFKIKAIGLDGEEVNSVNSRDIYDYLGIKQQYADWIKTAIDKYGFEEGIDFTVHKFVNGKATQKDYIVTIDMAKELCMISNTPKGKDTRKYLIKVEKKSRLPQKELTKIELAQMVIDSETKAAALEQRIEKKDEIILSVASLVIEAGECSVGDFAKNLAIEGLGPNNMYKYLRSRGFLMDNNAPYQPYVERGYFKRKPYEETYGGEVKYKTIVTPRGQVWLTKIINAEYGL